MYMRNLEQQLNGSYSVLVQLVTQCLHNTPLARPSSQQLLTRLLAIKQEIEDKHGGSMGTQLNITNILLLKEVKMKDKRITQLEVRFQISQLNYNIYSIVLCQASETRLEADYGELVTANATLEEEKRSIIADKTRIREESLQLENEKTQLENENAQLTDNNHRLETEIRQLKANNKQLQDRYEVQTRSLEDAISELQKHQDKTRNKRTQKQVNI